MQTLFDDVKQYFIDENWAVQQHESLHVMRIAFEGVTGNWPVMIRVLNVVETFVILSIYPDAIPEDRRQTVANLIAHENYHLDVANFEMNMQDGELRLRTSVDVTGGEVTHGIIHNAYMANIYTMNDYYDPLRKVIAGEWDINAATTHLRALAEDDDD